MRKEMTQEQIRQLANDAINEDMKELESYMGQVTTIIAKVYEKGLYKGIEVCERMNKQKGIIP